MTDEEKEFEEKAKELNLETGDIHDVPVFAAGTWNGDTYTEKDVEELAANFQETKGLLKPYLKLGHTEKQKMAQADGLPAVGWVENLRAIGGTLYADFKRVPKKIMELIRAGAYRRVSSELFINMNVQGKKFGKVLKGVALLGADTPAVHTLDDILALYALSGQAQSYGDDNETITVEFTDQSKEVTKMEELQKKLSEVTAEAATAKAESKELKARVEKIEAEAKQYKESLEKATKQLGEMEAEREKALSEKRETEINAYLDEAIKNKKITPAQKEHLFTLYVNLPEDKKFTVGEKEGTLKDIVNAFIDSNSVEVNTDENTDAGKANRNASDDDHSALAKKAMEYAEKNKVSYKIALESVSTNGNK